MQLRRITVTHTERNDAGAVTSVELVADVDGVPDGEPVAMIRKLTAAAIDGISASSPPPDDPPPAEESAPAQPARRRAAQTAAVPAVKFGSKGWRINCPTHGDHAANLFEERDGMPARIKCTAKEDGEFCKVGAPPPAGGGAP